MTLSIITINYNNRDGLQKTIDSVLSQTWTDYEWIIIDGGSTDGSKELIERYQENLAYWCSEPDKGVYNAMNKGIAKAKGEYLNFMNSGDSFYEADTLMKVFVKGRKADILYGDCLRLYENREVLHRYPQPLELYSLYSGPICHQAMMIRSSLLKDTGYDETFKICADYKHLMEMGLKGATIEYVGVPVCRYDMSGISSAYDEQFKREWEIAHQVFPERIRLSMEHLKKYAGNRHTVRTRLLLDRGGFAAFITKAVLLLLDKIFIRKDFTDYPYCN